MSLAEGNSSGAAAVKRGSVLLAVLRGLLVLAVLALIGVSVAAALSPLVPPFVLFTPFAAQVAGSALIAVVLGLALRMRRFVLVPLAVAVWQGVLVLPFLWPADRPAVSGEPLHVLSLNLWPKNPTPEKTVDYLLQSGADVIATIETGPEWRQRIKVLETIYPYRLDCGFTIYRCGVALFSKQPFESTFIGPVEDGPQVVVQARIEWQGKPLTIAALQIYNPLKSDSQAERGAAITRYFAALPGDALLMGDFNSVPWGPLQRQLRDGTPLDNRGRLAFTWPSWAPALLRIPIDQIFAAGGLAVRNYRAGPAVGSDHLPVLADIYRTAP